jgi:hypothetical protein
MDIFSLLTIWVYGLIVLFCLHAVATAVCKAVVEVTGSPVSDLAYEAYTWIVANPVWAWKLADMVAPDQSAKQNYFQF